MNILLPPIHLSYAPARRRRGRRWVIAATVAVVAVAVAAGWAWRRHGPAVSERLTLAWQWHQCVTYVGPPDRVPTPGQTPFLEPFRVQWDSGSIVYFLHSRRSKGGVERLVIVRGELLITPWPANDPDPPPDPPAGFEWMIYRLQVIDGAKPGTTEHWDCEGPNILIGEGKRGTVFNGQPDPADESHFTIEYEVDGRRGTVDGWLTDDYDRVRLKVRDGPALKYLPEGSWLR